jgi:multidrug transporter EmrE-like cation transporter
MMKLFRYINSLPVGVRYTIWITYGMVMGGLGAWLLSL